MPQMIPLFEVLSVFLVIILIGWLLKKTGTVSDRTKNDLNTLLMTIALPAMLINGFLQPFDKSLTERGFIITLLAIVALVTSFGVGLLIMKILKVRQDRQGVWLLVSTFSNLGFMGFPIIERMFGKEGLFLASFVQIPFGTLFFTVGALMMTRTQAAGGASWRKILLTPIMVAIEIGLVLYFFQIQLPGFFTSLLTMVGSMTGPLAMLIIGLKLAEVPLYQIFNSPSLYGLAFVRLLAAPLAVALVLRLLPSIGYDLLAPVMMVICAMPGPSNATNMAFAYGGDIDFAAKITALTAIMSLLTLPIVFLLV